MATQDSVWYYVKDGARQGPVSFEQMRGLVAQRHLLPGDMVWRDGLADWVPASSVPELGVVPPAPVPPPARAGGPPAPPARTGYAPQPATPYGYGQPAAIRRCAPFNSTARSQRIFLIVASGIAVISLFLPMFLIFYQTSSSAAMGNLPQAYRHFLQAYANAYIRTAQNHVLWGFDAWWSVMVFVLGLIGLAAAIVDLAMQTYPVVRQITRWIHWPVYSIILLFLLIGVIYTYESGLGYVSGFWFWIPLSPIIVLGASIAALIIGIKLCAADRPV